MINLQPASNQAANCHPPITHLLLSVPMCTSGGGFLSDCPANMPRLGGPALTWQSDGSVILCPRIQSKYVEICSDSMQSIFAVTDHCTVQDTGTADRLAYYKNALTGLIRTAIKGSLH